MLEDIATPHRSSGGFADSVFLEATYHKNDREGSHYLKTDQSQPSYPFLPPDTKRSNGSSNLLLTV